MILKGWLFLFMILILPISYYGYQTHHHYYSFDHETETKLGYGTALEYDVAFENMDIKNLSSLRTGLMERDAIGIRQATLDHLYDSYPSKTNEKKLTVIARVTLYGREMSPYGHDLERSLFYFKNKQLHSGDTLSFSFESLPSPIEGRILSALTERPKIKKTAQRVPFHCRIQFLSVLEALIPLFKIEDAMLDITGNPLAQVKQFTLGPAYPQKLEMGPNRWLHAPDHAQVRNIIAVLEGKGSREQNDVFFLGKPLRVGSTFVFKTWHYALEGTIQEIHLTLGPK